MTSSTFEGYVRADGSVGIRNHILVLPTVTCSAVVCERIVDAVGGCVTVSHQHGCSQIGQDAKQTYNVLKGFGTHPNVGAVLVVSLGCEVVDGERLVGEIAESGRPVQFLRIQDVGGSIKTIEKGIELATEMKQTLQSQNRELVPVDRLTVAVKYGDGLNPFQASPIEVAYFLRELALRGTRVMIGELEKVADGLATDQGGNYPNKQSPAANGQRHEWASKLSHIQTRSSTRRALIDVEEARGPGIQVQDKIATGSFPDLFDLPVTGVWSYAEPVSGTGLHLVDTPCSDVECLTGYAAGGASLAVFFTDVGTPVGNPIMPVVKVSSIADSIWSDHVDVTLADTGAVPGTWEACLAVASGKWTVAELLGHQEFAVHRIGISL